MKFGFAVALLGAISSVISAPSHISSRNSTNAERLARGLAPNKPGRLFDASRRGAILPRASGNSPTPMNIVSTGTQGQQAPRRKKRAPVNITYQQGYVGVGLFGSLIYSSSSADAQNFYWDTTTTPPTLYWTATFTNVMAGITSGNNYPIFARSVGSLGQGIAPVFNLMVGSSQQGDISNWMSTARFPGDVNARPANNDFIVFSFGDFHLNQQATISVTNDFAAARAYYNNIEANGQPQEIILQTLPTTSAWSISAAMNFYQQGTKLVNPVVIHAQDYTGQITGWSTILNSMFQLQTAGSGQLFYLPLLNSGKSRGPMIYTRSGLTCTIGTTGINDPVTPQPIEYDTAQDTLYLPVTMNRAQYAVVFFPTFDNTYGLTAANPSAVAVTNLNGLPFNTYPTAQPICMETLPVGGTPSSCNTYYAALKATNLINMDAGYHLYVYDQTENANGYYNLEGPATTGAVPTVSTTAYSVFNTLTFSGSTSPYLFSYYQQIMTELYTATAGNVPNALPQSPPPSGWNPLAFSFSNNIINGLGGVLQANSGAWWYSTTAGDPVLQVAASAPSANYRAVCLELVPLGGSPQYCAPN